MVNVVFTGIGIAFVILALFYWIVIGRPKRKAKKQQQKLAKTQDIKDEKTEHLGTNRLKIIIWRSLGEDLVAQVGEPIIAEEVKDENNNLLVINDKANFKEDFNFSIDRVYEVMNYSLKLKDKTNRQKAELIKPVIDKQEKLLMEIDANPDLNKQYNYPDEELKLKQLKIFYDSLYRSNRGNYMRLGANGIRQFEFIAIDGILYPYFFGSKQFRVYPDLTIKKKIFNHENTIFDKETAALQNSMIGWITVIMLMLGVFMVLGNGFWTYKNMTSSHDISTEANAAALTCTNTLAQIQKNYGGIVNDYLNEVKKQTQNIKNNENANNDILNNAISGSINIDPTGINK